MSDALKVLEEIEGRLKAATPGPWGYESQTGSCWYSKEFRGPGGSMIRFRSANERGELQFVNFTVQEWMREADAALIAHAAADLALLARLVRSVAEQACEGASEGLPDEVWSCETNLAACDPATWCTSCRIRRELSEAVRCQ